MKIKRLFRERGVRAMGAGVLIGLSAAVAMGQGSFPHLCQYCHTVGESTFCDTILCFGNGCTGQVCQGKLTVVRACCGSSCPNDDWQDTCDNEQ